MRELSLAAWLIACQAAWLAYLLLESSRAPEQLRFAYGWLWLFGTPFVALTSLGLAAGYEYLTRRRE